MNIETVVSKSSWRFGGVRQPAYTVTFIFPVEDIKQALITEGADAVAVELFKVLIAELRALEGGEVGQI